MFVFDSKKILCDFLGKIGSLFICCNGSLAVEKNFQMLVYSFMCILPFSFFGFIIGHFLTHKVTFEIVITGWEVYLV